MDVQGGYMLFRGVICCSGGLYAVQEGYMLKKIMMILVATNVVASRQTAMPTAFAKRKKNYETYYWSVRLQLSNKF